MKESDAISLKLSLVALACLSLLTGFMASAADKKKLYCWEENHAKTCSDTLPPDAINQAHDVLNAANGMQKDEVNRAPTSQEQAEQARIDAKKQSEEATQETQRRAEKALLVSYATEEELRRVFVNRREVIDNNLSSATYSLREIQKQLAALLQTAGNQELTGEPISEGLVKNIQARLTALASQYHIKTTIKQQQSALDKEIQDTLERYRALKGQTTKPGQNP